jgi:predicted  nucleic acid-binding Zn-ribbon protein
MDRNELINLANELSNMPESIAQRQMEIIRINQNLQEVEDQLITKESELKQEIANTLDVNGKKAYSNQEARDAAFVAESKSDASLQALYSERESIKRSLATEKIEMEKLSNQQRNLRSILYALGGIQDGVLNS